MECPGCRHANREGARFCGACGAPLPVLCPKCGAPNPSAASFCDYCGARLTGPAAAAAKSHSSSAAVSITTTAAAERRQLTVMFCDLVGSTGLSARLDPEDMRELIALYRKCVTDAVAPFEGFIAQHLGDGVLVYFGYPQAHEDDAERAIKAGLAAIVAVDGLKAHSVTPLKARAGIATGIVVVGEQIGADDSRERVAIGETPNLAARLQAIAAPGEVVIAASTRRLVGRMFDCRALGSIEVKGLPQPVEAWQVRGETTGVNRFEALHATALTPLVGRQEEIELLLRRWHQAKLGEGRVVLFEGEPGIGKSRIAESLLARVEEEPHARLRYFCSPHHTQRALYPFLVQLGRAAGFGPDDGVGTKLDKLEILLKPTARNVPQDLALIAELLGIPEDGRYPVVDVSSQKKREMTLTALLDQLIGLTALKPVLMVFEDAHWIDPTSIDLLDRIIARVANLPVLLVITFRPEFQPTWVGQPHVTMLPLSRLDRRDSVAMIVGVTKGKELPDAVAEQVLARTDGVPLFIEELTSALLESGLMRETPDRYVLDGPLPPLAIPTTLQASLVARLDRLASVKDVAQIGAAIGREFSHELIDAVASLSPADLDRALERLIRAGLISRRGMPPDATYSFKHALVQDAAYATLLKKRRQPLHATIANVLIERFPSTAESQPEVVAHHFTEAGLASEAIGYWRKAGAMAQRRSANKEAISHLRHALDAVGHIVDEVERTKTEVELHVGIGAAFMAARGFGAPEVLEAYSRAERLCDRLGERADIFPALWGQWLFRVGRSELDAAQRLCGRLLALAGKSGDAGFKLQAHHAAWATSFGRGELAEVQAHTKAGLGFYDAEVHRAMASSYGNHDASACALNFSALSLAFAGEEQRARSTSDSALAVARGLNDPFTTALALYFSSATAQVLGDVTLSAQYAEASRQLSTEHGFPYVRALSTCVAGWCAAENGDSDRGIALLTDAIAQLQAAQDRQFMSYLLGLLCGAHMKGGHHAEAMKAVKEGIALAAANGERYYSAELHRLHGELLAQTRNGASKKAEAEFRLAIKTAKQQGARLLERKAVESLHRRAV
jgi:class 3 adenylate cyclase/predicted ATPase